MASAWPGALQWLKKNLADLLRMKFRLSLSQEYRQRKLKNTVFGEESSALFRRGAMTGIANQSKEPAAARTELG